MITPRFQLSQDDNTVTIVIRAPYCSLRELDISVDENAFIFSCQPYYLRLQLPGSIEDNDRSKSSFDSDSGVFTLQYEKVNQGEHFPDLQLITKFLVEKIQVEDGNRKIEIINSQEQNLEPNTENLQTEYGFAMRGGYNFKVLSNEFKDTFEINPYEVPLKERHKLRQETEIKQFDADHYCADFMDNAEINELQLLTSPWKKFTKADTKFSEKELDFLKDLPNINYNLNPQQIKYCHNSLIDILYAYCYDYRTTYFETTCESGWTIAKLSASLCWFDSFSNPKETLVSAFRRSLIYPLYRDFKLSQQILEDLKILISLGEPFIIKCLINLYNIFLQGDSCRYIYNNLFIKDYVVYLMKWDKNLWQETVQEFENVKIEKNDLGLNLTQIEEEIRNYDLNATMENLNISAKSSDTTDSDDLTSSSSESED